MVRTTNAITIPDLNQEVAKMYAKVNSLAFMNEGKTLSVEGIYFYYQNDDLNTQPVIFARIDKQYSDSEYNVLYAALTITSTDKSDQVKEEIDKTLPSQIIATFPNLGLTVNDFEVYIPS